MLFEKYLHTSAAKLTLRTATSVTSQTQVRTSTGTNNGIFGSLSMYNKGKKYLNKANTDTHIQTTQEPDFIKLQNKGEEQIKQLFKLTDTGLSDFNVGGGPIYFSNWIKFFKYHSKTGQKPSTFFKNNHYFKQFKTNPTADLNSKDEKGVYNFIRSEKYFFVNLFEDSITISTDKHVYVNNYY